MSKLEEKTLEVLDRLDSAKDRLDRLIKKLTEPRVNVASSTVVQIKLVIEDLNAAIEEVKS